MEYLANDCVRIYESPCPQTVFTYTPGICVLPGGRLLATLDLGGKGVKDLPGAETGPGMKWYSLGKAFLSDDGGKTWRHTVDFPFCHARPFAAGNSVYILGHLNDLRVIRSDDWGETWSPVSQLTDHEFWHQSACNVWYKEDQVYLVMEKTALRPGETPWGWPVSQLAPVLMRGSIHKDLCRRENWTFASELRFDSAVDERDLNYHGIPFYPTRKEIPEKAEGQVVAEPVGWLETNVVQILDPAHYWYDPSGHTFQLFMRAHTAGTGYCMMAQVKEEKDGSMTTSLMKAPSGRTWVFLPMPGGQMRFHMLYDSVTRLYWLLSTQAVDSMRRKELLDRERYGLPCDERRRMVLHFSRNCVDWCFAGIVAAGPSEKQSRHYACMAIDGQDLVIASRSGDENCYNAHNTDFISFHRVRNFRDLVY